MEKSAMTHRIKEDDCLVLSHHHVKTWCVVSRIYMFPTFLLMCEAEVATAITDLRPYVPWWFRIRTPSLKTTSGKQFAAIHLPPIVAYKPL